MTIPREHRRLIANLVGFTCALGIAVTVAIVTQYMDPLISHYASFLPLIVLMGGAGYLTLNFFMADLGGV